MMMMKMTTSKFVFKLCLSLVCHFVSPGLSFQPEFVRSFLSRPWMLSNQSLNDPITDKPLNQATVSLYFDNWSPYDLDLSNDELHMGTFSIEGHDQHPYSRGLALRSVSSSESKKSSGLISWTIVNVTDNTELARLSIAWEIGNGIGSRFSVQLSDVLPQFKEMWAKNNYVDRAQSNNLDDTVYIGEMHKKLLFLVVANMTMNEGDTLHYRLRVSLVPNNVDVWSWVKWYREPHEAKTTEPTPTKRPATSSDQTSTRKKAKLDRKRDKLDDEKPSMFDQKHLLKNDTELRLLHENNMSLREALIRRTETSIALGLRIENWSAYPLSEPNVDIESGTVVKNDTTAPVPSSVPAGSADVSIILPDEYMKGTSGVIRYTLGSSDLVLSIMWSVPYNRHFYSTFVAVGLSSHTNQPTYKEMNGNGNDPRFIKRKAGKHFEFSDGRFIVLVDMDGDSVFKPILSVSLVPRDNSLLAANIRQQLGMKPSLISRKNNVLDNDNSDFNYQKTQQQIHKRQDQPSVGLIQTGSGSSRTLLVSTTTTTSALWLIIMLGLFIH